MRLLVVEDEPKLGALIVRALRAEGHAVDLCETGEDALWRAGSVAYDAIVLDFGLPGIDGFETCRRLRADEIWSPVLMLTARDAVADRVEGLDVGADDYLVKPFSFAELAGPAAGAGPPRRRRAPDDAGGRRAAPGPGAPRGLARGATARRSRPRSTRCSRPSCAGPARSCRASPSSSRCWDESYEHRSNVVDAYVRLLRDKIDRPFGTDSIETVRGVGYRLCAPPSSS